MNDNVPSALEPIDVPAPTSPEEWASLELWRLLIGVLKTVGGRVTVDKDLLTAIDLEKDDLKIFAGEKALTIQTGNGLRS